MIVRPIDAGAQIIPQPDHAYASGRVARMLSTEWIEDADARTLIDLISHHDDGWVEWEVDPRLDSHGMPVNFLDITPAEHEAIWRRGIDRIENDLGPFAAAVLVRHVQALGHDIGNQQWENHLAQRYATLVRAALPDEDPARREWRIERAFHVLRFCDLATLLPAVVWSGPGSVTMIHDDGRHQDFDLYTQDADWRIGVMPWPFREHTIKIPVPLLDVGWGEWPNALKELRAGRRRNQILEIVPAD